jgi:class 3 adenylate cyclase
MDVRAPTFGYARADDGAYIGYRVEGTGPIDIVVQPEWPGNIDLEWDDTWLRPWLGSLAEIGRVITHDHRGVGVSSRDKGLPTLETRVTDLMRVVEAVDASRPVMIGYLSTGAVNAMAAAMHPTFPRAIVWLEPVARYAWAPDHPWGSRREELDDELAHLSAWGTEEYGRWFLDLQGSSDNALPESAIDVARQSRNACTPDVARELSKIWFETDVRGILPSVTTPTLLLVHEERTTFVEQAEQVAGLMPSAELSLLPGSAWTVEEQPRWLDEIRRFLGKDLPAPAADTILASVLFTDIVDSTRTQARVGDRAWKELIGRHHALVRASLERWQGTENDTAGDGFYATFPGPARAIRCALEMIEELRDLGIEIRAGVHTGECELIEGKCSGLSVSIGARVMSEATGSQVLVSQTVKDLVAGSGFRFDDAGERDLKGVPDRWRLYRVVA